MNERIKKMQQRIERVVEDDVRMPLYWCYFFLALCTCHIFVKVFFGDVVNKPLSFIPNLVLGYVCIAEITKIKESIGKEQCRGMLVYVSVLGWISYSAVLLVYGSLLGKIIALLSPIYLSWRFGIKRLIYKNKKEEKTR